MQELRGQRAAQEGRQGGEVPALQRHGAAMMFPAPLISGLNMRKHLAILVMSCWATLAYAQKADLIVTNAKIVTLDQASTIAQALAVRDGRIVAIGGNDAMEGLTGSATR